MRVCVCGECEIVVMQLQDMYVYGRACVMKVLVYVRVYICVCLCHIICVRRTTHTMFILYHLNIHKDTYLLYQSVYA